MDYIECEVPQSEGYCTDNECPCAPAQLARGEGYLLITPEIVEFRRSALTRAQLQDVLAPRLKAGEYISSTAYEPMLICEQAARTRGLDMEVAAEDARKWWESGRAPLRATPTAGENASSATESPAARKPAPEESAAQQPPEPAPAPAQPPPVPAEPAEKQSTAPQTESISAEEVAEQFADGPLAQLAAKMARGHESGDARAQDNQPEPGAAATNVNPSDESTVVAAVQPQRLDEEPEENPAAAAEPDKPKKKPGTGVAVALYALLAALTLVVGVVGVLVLRKIHAERKVADEPLPASISLETDKDDPLRAVEFEPEAKAPDSEEPAEPAEPADVQSESNEPAQPAPKQRNTTSVQPPNARPALRTGFFENVYSFRDSRYQGAIEFREVEGGQGAYRQQVRIAGKPKVYTVEGRFVATDNRIVFRPEGAETQVVWELEKLDPGNGSAVFYDPRQEDRAASRVYLTPSR